MLTISQPITGTDGANYYLSLAREDYYLNGGEPPGRWHGGLARQFGLAGEVSPATLRRLFTGYSPDGSTPLVQNAGDPERRNGWDLTFSAPKTVSVLWSQADPETRARLQAAHAAAVASTLDLLERTVAYTRSGKGGRHWERTPIVAAVFEHGTSRALDPQLHSHALVLNLAQRRNGRTGALESSEFFAVKMGLGAHYQAFLADRLHRDLGVAIEWTGQTFRLPQVPQALSDEMSKRRKAMLAVFAETGGYSAVAAKAVALATRPGKVEVARSTLFEQWQQVGREFGWSQAEARRLIAPHGRTPQERPAKEAEEFRQDSPRPSAAGRVTPEKAEPKAEPARESKTGREREGTQERPQERTAGENRRREDQRPPPSQAEAPPLSGPKPSEASQSGPKQPKSESARRSEAWTKIGASLRKLVPLEVRRKHPFWRAPQWNAARRVSVPYLALKRQSKRSRKTEQVIAEKKLPFVRVQVRKGYLFPQAPGWSPASKVRSYRVAVVSAAAAGRKEQARAEKAAAGFAQGQRFTFRTDNKVLGVKAGDWATVVRTEKAGIVVRFDDGTHRRIDLRKFPDLRADRSQRAARPDSTARQEQARRDKEAEARRKREAEERRRKEEEERRRRESAAHSSAKTHSHSHSR
jgi:conjugative relaxase-like TrwC/TraI family protein